MFKGFFMKKLLLIFMLFSTFSGVNIFALEDQQANFEHAVWNGIPIKFNVQVGQERILHFSSSVLLKNIDHQLSSDQVKILNNNGYIYIKALQKFDSQRLGFVIKKTGQVVLIDIAGVDSATLKPLSIVLSSTDGSQKTAQNKKNSSDVSMVDLMRFSIKKLYAPQRLQEQEGSIYRAPMNTSKSVHLLASDNLMAMPLASWTNGGEYVTAVLLKNTDGRTHYIDPRRIRGSWVAASLFPSNRVSKAGSVHDRTTLLLISDRPFNDAINSTKEFRL
jgi:integrating conjugative element protein (TIGR03749 family)